MCPLSSLAGESSTRSLQAMVPPPARCAAETVEPPGTINQYSSGGMLPRRYPIIIGPTAGGKTALAVEVALRLNDAQAGSVAEIVSADSMLIYKGLDIGDRKSVVLG